jgi:hypothetical protein
VTEANSRLELVLAQLKLYEHPLLDFSARAKGEAVEVIIDFKNPQFEWGFQRQLYDCLHDYMVEMFIRTPQDRADRQRKGL